MNQSDRLTDEVYTRRMEEYMDTQYDFADAERITDKRLQQKGIDIVLHDGENDKLIDEKYALAYRNSARELETYSFELTSDNNFNREGWFVSPNSVTTHYLLVWFRSDEAIDIVKKYDAVLISKEAIKSILKEHGVDTDKVIEEFANLKNEHTSTDTIKITTDADDKTKATMFFGNIKAVKSLSLREKPLNIIIPKSLLIERAEKHWSKKCPVERDAVVNEYKQRLAERKAPVQKEEINLDAVISKKAKELIKRGILAGNLMLLKKGEQTARAGAISRLDDGDKIIYAKNPQDKSTYETICTYNQEMGKWITKNNSIKSFGTIGGRSFADYKKYQEKLLIEGKIPEGSKIKDYYHRYVKYTPGEDLLQKMLYGEQLTVNGIFDKPVTFTYNKNFGVLVTERKDIADKFNGNIKCIPESEIRPYNVFASRIHSMLHKHMCNVVAGNLSYDDYLEKVNRTFAIATDNEKYIPRENEDDKLSPEEITTVTKYVNPERFAEQTYLACKESDNAISSNYLEYIMYHENIERNKELEI